MQSELASERAEAVRDEIANARLSLANAFLNDVLDDVQRDLATAVLGLLSINSRLASIVADLSAEMERSQGEHRAPPLPRPATSYSAPEWLESDLEKAA